MVVHPFISPLRHVVGVDGLEPPNSMREHLQCSAIATMRYPNFALPIFTHCLVRTISVTKERFELSRLSTLVPKTNVSTIPPLGHVALSENYDISTPSLTVMCSASELRKRIKQKNPNFIQVRVLCNNLYNLYYIILHLYPLTF